MELNGVRLPSWYNGCGCHDSPGCYVATMNYSEARAHAEELKDHGVTLDKLFVSGGNKVERARGEVDGGILVAIRDWKETPWGRPPASWVMPVDQIRMYADAGVQLFEIAGNEINIGAEHNGPMPQDPAVLARQAVEAFEVALNACAQVPGTYPLLTSCTPGGNVDHRRVYPAIIAELNRRGLMPNVKHVAIHPRPHNNPPETKWTATNTVTFDEWTWIRDHFPTSVYFWATEHGYSLGDDQNHNYPRIDLQKHTDYNWTLDTWMNPGHASAIEPNLAGFCHWFEAGWGHWGAWPKDALRDSIVPEMPAPAPVWVRMGERVTELEFNRYGDEPEPPPPPPPPPGGEVKIYDGSGTERDWVWLHGKYGAGVHVDTPAADAYWKIAEIRENLGGASSVTVKAPPGTEVMFWYTTAPTLPSTVNREWAAIGDHGTVEPKGEISFGMYGGAAYNPANAPYMGPHNLWCGTSNQHSEQFVGEGWLMGTEHHHLDIKYEWFEGEPEPPPPEDWAVQAKALLVEAQAEVDEARTRLDDAYNGIAGALALFPSG